MVEAILESSIRFVPEVLISMGITGAYIWRQVTIHDYRLNHHDETLRDIRECLSEIRNDLKNITGLCSHRD